VKQTTRYAICCELTPPLALLLLLLLLLLTWHMQRQDSAGHGRSPQPAHFA
jgi:hypothetical protein